VKVNGTIKTPFAIGGMILAAVVAFGVTSIPKMLSADAVAEERFTEISRRIVSLEEWGPNSGDRYSRADANSDWKVHLVEYQSLQRKLDALLIHAGIDPSNFN